MTEQDGFVFSAGELPLSSAAMVELMQDVLSKKKTFRFRAQGFSMAPFIQDGDVISISPFCDSLPGVGEVVAFIDPQRGKLIVHRIVAREGCQYSILGDNQLEFGYDSVSVTDILGRVTSIDREGREIRLGLGPEKSLIALFSRKHLLQPIILKLAPVVRPLMRVLS